MHKGPLNLQDAKVVARQAMIVFGHQVHDKVLETLGKTDPPGQMSTLSVSDFITYLSKTIWPQAWTSAYQVDQLLHSMARQGILARTAPAAGRSPLFSDCYLNVGGMAHSQAGGYLWMMPVLNAPLLVDAVQPALVHLTGRTAAHGDEHGGTGLAISPRHILTAKHVVEDMALNDVLDVPQSGGGTARVEVVDQTVHPDQDLAVVTIDDSIDALAPVAGLVTREPGWSDKIFLLGYPPIPTAAQAAVTVQAGEVVNPDVETYFKEHLFLYSAIARPGNSGGPILGHDGRLLGMVVRELSQTGAEFTPAPFYAGLPARVIHSCLRELNLGDYLLEETWD